MSEGPQLTCLGNGTAPPEFVEGWKKFLAFPRGAQDEFWNIVRQALVLPDPAAIETAGRQFCNNHGIDENDGALALQVFARLTGQAAALDTTREQFRDDLMRLGGGDSVAAEFVAARFHDAKPTLRAAITMAVLADHGKVLSGLSWRVDAVQASDRAVNLNATVVHLSLSYVEGTEQGRINLQLTPESLQLLKAFTNRF